MDTNTWKFKLPVFLVLFTLFLVIFFPGSYSVDSWNFYFQFANNQYNDWHSPVFAYMWKLLNTLTGKFYSIYIVQMLLFWLMGYVLVTKVNRSNTAFVVTILLSVLFIWMPQYVMKDTHNAIAWGLAVALMLVGAKDEKYTRGLWPLIVLLLIMYGFFVRSNAVVALLPLLFLYVGLYWMKQRGALMKGLISVMLLVGMFIANNTLNYSVLKAKHTYPEYKLMMMDLIGVSLKTNRNYLPICVTSADGYNFDSIKTNYTPASIDNLYWPATGVAPIPAWPDSALTSCVKDQWIKTIQEQPGAYLVNRMDGYTYYLRLKKRFEKGDYWNTTIWIDASAPFPIERKNERFAQIFTMGSFDMTFFFDPWFWLLLNIAGCIYFFSWYRKNKQREYHILALIQLSGVLYILSQFPVFQHDRDFRYNYWNVIVFMIGLVFIAGKPKAVSK